MIVTGVKIDVVVHTLIHVEPALQTQRNVSSIVVSFEAAAFTATAYRRRLFTRTIVCGGTAEGLLALCAQRNAKGY